MNFGHTNAKCFVSRTDYFVNVTVCIIQLTLDSNGKLSLNAKGGLKLASSICKNAAGILDAIDIGFLIENRMKRGVERKEHTQCKNKSLTSFQLHLSNCKFNT